MTIITVKATLSGRPDDTRLFRVDSATLTWKNFTDKLQGLFGLPVQQPVQVVLESGTSDCLGSMGDLEAAAQAAAPKAVRVKVILNNNNNNNNAESTATTVTGTAASSSDAYPSTTTISNQGEEDEDDEEHDDRKPCRYGAQCRKMFKLRHLLKRSHPNEAGVLTDILAQRQRQDRRHRHGRAAVSPPPVTSTPTNSCPPPPPPPPPPPAPPVLPAYSFGHPFLSSHPSGTSLPPRAFPPHPHTYMVPTPLPPMPPMPFPAQVGVQIGRIETQVNQLVGLVDQLVKRPAAVPPPSTSTSTGSETRMKPVHSSVVCDHCKAMIVGVRYKCGHCVDFDLCESCEHQLTETESPAIHDPTHVFLKIRRVLDRRAPAAEETPQRHHHYHHYHHYHHNHHHEWAMKPLLRQFPVMVPPTAVSEATPPSFPAAVMRPSIRFVGDVTVPDRAEFEPGTRFVKVWALQNTGTQPWPAGLRVVRTSKDDRLTNTSSFSLPATPNPGEIVNISVNMTAPMEPGTYQSVWALAYSNGQLAEGPQFWAEIVVVAKKPATQSPKPSPFVAIDDTVAQAADLASGLVSAATIAAASAAAAVATTTTTTTTTTLNEGTKGTVAPPNTTTTFELGDRLEAIDRLYPGLLCVATVKAVDRSRNAVQVTFDGWDERYDYWSLPPHTDLAPVGTAAELQLQLQPPKQYDRPFDWTEYLARVRARAAPREAFPTLGNRGSFANVTRIAPVAAETTQTATTADEPAQPKPVSPEPTEPVSAPEPAEDDSASSPVFENGDNTNTTNETEYDSDSFVALSDDDGFQEELAQLMDMGFCNRKENLRLLRQHQGSINAVISALVEHDDLN